MAVGKRARRPFRTGSMWVSSSSSICSGRRSSPSLLPIPVPAVVLWPSPGHAPSPAPRGNQTTVAAATRGRAKQRKDPGVEGAASCASPVISKSLSARQWCHGLRLPLIVSPAVAAEEGHGRRREGARRSREGRPGAAAGTAVVRAHQRWPGGGGARARRCGVPSLPSAGPPGHGMDLVSAGKEITFNYFDFFLYPDLHLRPLFGISRFF
jgi:hypothetical protein